MSALCNNCEAGCIIVSDSTLIAIDSRIKPMCLDEKPEIRNYVDLFVLEGNSDVCGCIGENCFSELCAAIIKAQDEANAHNDLNPGENKKHLEFLEDRWLNLITNRFFKMMYAAYIVFYYYELGYGTSQVTPNGDVKDNSNTNQFAQRGISIGLKDAQSKANKQLIIAKTALKNFEEKFLDKNRTMYPCLPQKKCNYCQMVQCECEEEYCERPRSVAM